MLYFSDPILTTKQVVQVNDLESLQPRLIPHSRFNAIQSKYSTKEEISNQCASYYVNCSVQPSWMELAGSLYRHGEFSAVKQLKPFLPVRGKYQVISYARMNHAFKACAVYVFCHGLHNV